MIINSYTLLYIILILLLGIALGIIMIIDEKKANINNKNVSININMDIVEFLKNTNTDICKNDYNIPTTTSSSLNNSEYETFMQKEIFQKIKVG